MLTPEQKAIRATRIGSSEVGAILGVDPHRSAFDVFNNKLYPKDEESPEMRWGSSVEQAIIEYHAARERCTWYPGTTLCHPNGITCATPDAFLQLPSDATRKVDGITVQDYRFRVLECKSVGYYRADLWGEEGDDAPFHYLAQVHWQIGHAKADSFHGLRTVDDAHLVPAVGGTPPRKYVVQFDPELFGIMMQRAEKFNRDHLATGKPPPLDGSDAADEYLRRRYGLEVQEVLPYDGRADTYRQAILDLEKRADEIDSARKTLRQQLCDLIGDAAGIEGVATWKRCKDSTGDVTDWKFIAETLATRMQMVREQWDALVKQTTQTVVTRQGSRRLILSRPKKAKAAKAA